MTTPSQLRVGFFAIGNAAYWPQFPGLQDRLCAYAAQLVSRIAAQNVLVSDLGMIDTPECALAAGHAMRRADVDLLVMYVATYALSHTVLPVVRRAKVPVLILNVQPGPSIDYAALHALPDRRAMTGEWLTWCSACPVPEIASVFKRCGIAFHQLTGTLQATDPVWGELQDWLAAARVVSVLEHTRCGVMGHVYNGMMDIACDPTAITAALGVHMEVLEVETLVSLRDQVSEAECAARVNEFHQRFDIRSDCSQVELQRAARCSVALDRMVAAYDLGALAYYHMGTGVAACEDVMSSVILGNSLLTARGIPVAGEYELKNVQAMKILDTFGVGGSFSEFYAIDFADDVVLLGHDGPGHLAIAQGPARVRPLEVYHGKVGRGLSIEMSVSHGPVTVLSLVQEANGSFSLLVAEGESCPGPILEIGNTNSRYRFACGAKAFVERWNAQGPAHHCAIGLGHVAHRITKLAALLSLPVVQVC